MASEKAIDEALRIWKDSRIHPYDERKGMGSALDAAAAVDGDALAEIRAAGWMVAVHNDYRLNGEFHTFWLFTKDDRAVKGEGKTDAEALACALAAIRSLKRG